MKRVGIHHEGHQAGPFGERAGPWMANWRQAELQLARARAVDDEHRAMLFGTWSRVALRRTLDGREN